MIVLFIFGICFFFRKRLGEELSGIGVEGYRFLSFRVLL